MPPLALPCVVAGPARSRWARVSAASALRAPSAAPRAAHSPKCRHAPVLLRAASSWDAEVDTADEFANGLVRAAALWPGRSLRWRAALA